VLFRIRLSTARRLFGRPDPYHQERLQQLGDALMAGGAPPLEQRTRDLS
jgi:hypothetical protein